MQKLETSRKHGTLAFIIGNTVSGILTFVQKSREVEKEKKTSRIVNAESGSLTFVSTAVRVFNGHLSFTFNFIFQ